MSATPFSIGIPVFNEEAILVANTERLLAFLAGLGREHQVIIGSNGSTDSTTPLGLDLSRRFADVEFFHLAKRGVGRAFREFVARARHPYLISIDMDLSTDLSFIPEALELLTNHDIVVGSKKMGLQKRSRFRKLGSDSFLFAARQLLGLDYDDYSIAAKGYRVEFLRTIPMRIHDGSAYVLELCLAAQGAGRRIIQIPVSCEDWRRSKFNLLHEGIHKWSNLFTLSVRRRFAITAPGSPSQEAGDG